MTFITTKMKRISRQLPCHHEGHWRLVVFLWEPLQVSTHPKFVLSWLPEFSNFHNRLQIKLCWNPNLRFRVLFTLECQTVGYVESCFKSSVPKALTWWAPCWPHEICYLGRYGALWSSPSNQCFLISYRWDIHSTPSHLVTQATVNR